MTISATNFKATCLALLDEIEERGGQIIITKRGKPVAVLGPVPKTAWKSPADSLKGKGRIVGDIVHSDPDIRWEAME
jgi:prevent-host-death family protein